MIRVGKFSGRDTTVIPGHGYQCPVCFELFASEKTFVFHRVPDRTPPGRPGARLLGPCQDPDSKGMTLDGNGVWKWYPAALGADKTPVASRGPSHAIKGVY